VKKSIHSQLFVHEEHLDLDIPINEFPFDVQLGQMLFCQVKDRKNLGNKLDGKVHLVITNSPKQCRLAERIMEGN
jgi:hypothetical protein